MRSRLNKLGLLLLLVGLWSGCGENNPLSRQPVSGTVLVDGQPLAKGSIAFVPTKPGSTMSGGPVKDGQYSLTEDRGLPPGDYAVNINATDPNWKFDPKTMREDVAPEWIPVDYSRDGVHKVTVKPSGSNVFKFEISRKGP
jgi:hypothetical protein